MSEKIIFLDVDGVICLYPEWQQDWRGNQNDCFNEVCCKNLKAVVDETNARLVVTSSWRLGDAHFELLINQLIKCSIAVEGLDRTIDLSSDESIKTHNQLRWAEIKEYITRNCVKNYIILDDFNLEKYDKDHLVRTKRNEGLTSKLKEVCIRKLNVMEE